MGEKTSKLRMTFPQKRLLIAIICQNWEIGLDSTYSNGGWWMQQGGLGRGGPAQKVNSRTAFILCERKWIKAGKRTFPTTHYMVTDLGKAALEEQHRREETI